METKRRHVLMLQGPFSWFFTHLARALRDRGARVTRVLFCPGDVLFWRGPGAVRFRGRLTDWPDFVAGLAAREGVTDLVCLGDGRELHRLAIAALPDVRVHVVEQGYLRPGWLTVDAGLGPASRFPRDPAAVRALAGPAAPEPRFRTSFAGFSAMDVAWNLANLATGWAWFPHYRPHMLHGPLAEWAGWAGKAVRWPWRRAGRDRALARIAGHRGPVFLVALQLETDFMIRRHGPPGGLRGALARVGASFRARAPADALLVVKPHPLDNGLAPWRRRAEAEGAVFLDGGDLAALLPRLAGVVTVNSTVGLQAIRAGVPVCPLGHAIWDIEGLTGRDLDAFWSAPPRPDADLAEALVRALAATIQVPGGFDGEGVLPGAANVAEKVLHG